MSIVLRPLANLESVLTLIFIPSTIALRLRTRSASVVSRILRLQCLCRWCEAARPGPQSYISATVTFGTGPGGQLICAFIEGLMELLETTLTPELLGIEQDIDEEISMYFPE